LPHPEDRGRPVNEARWSNKLLEHLDHLRETNDLFGNVAKGRYGTAGSLKTGGATRFRGDPPGKELEV
jgi:hypothetical protein